MIEDIIAQSHTVVDTLTFDEGSVALSALRAISDNPGHTGPFGQLLDIRITRMAGGHCSATMEVRHHHLNPLGIAHGGATFALGDTVCGGAALSALGEPRVVTQDVQIRYHSAIKPGNLCAEAEVLHQGRHTITTRCAIYQDELLAASLTASFAILDKQEMKQVWHSSAVENQTFTGEP